MKSNIDQADGSQEYLVRDVVELIGQDEVDEWLRPQELEGIPLQFIACEVREGKYGEFLLLTAKRLDTGRTVSIMTGGRYVRKVFDLVMEHGMFPIKGTFARQGRTWVLR